MKNAAIKLVASVAVVGLAIGVSIGVSIISPIPMVGSFVGVYLVATGLTRVWNL